MSALCKPIPEDDFLETQAGQDWLAESVDDLLNRSDIEAPNAVGKNQVLVSHHRLIEAFADDVASRIVPGRCIEQILIVLSKRDDGSDLHRLAIRAIGRFQAVPELARCLIAEHANEYRDAKIESDQIIEECGF